MRYWLLLFLLLAGCGDVGAGDETAVPPSSSPPFTLAAGFTARALPATFTQPTQFLVEGNYLWLAQLNGGENENQGQVLRLDLSSGQQTVIVEGLDKPTGIALLNGMLWIATRDELLRMNPDQPDSLVMVLTSLPHNGRSNGTLTVTPDGRLLYETSGNGNDPASGRLWQYDPQTNEQHELAQGLKNGYAHVFDGNGRLWITEIGDGSLDGVTFTDELNLVIEGADFGWPHCYGRELGGTDCTGVRPAVAVFPDHSTPTGIAVSPFAENALLVALWMTGKVVEIPISLVDSNAVGEYRPFISQMQNPQHLIVHDGALWVSEFGTGKIWVVERP
jgi:glucose/arabinose dehydrogenase